MTEALFITAACGLLGLILGFAALHKLSRPHIFLGQVQNYRLLPKPFAPVAAAGLAFCEMVVGPALIVPAWRAEGGWAAAGLFLLYAAAMAANLARGRADIDCGCGGPGQPIAWALVGRNLAYSALAVAVALWPAPAQSGAQVAAGLAGGGLLWLLALSFERLHANAGRFAAEARG